MNEVFLINREVNLSWKALKDEKIQEKKEVAPRNGATPDHNSS